MTFRPTALERAFELARSGDYATVSDIKAQLNVEGFLISQVEGPALLRQLRALCESSQRSAPDQKD